MDILPTIVSRCRRTVACALGTNNGRPAKDHRHARVSKNDAVLSQSRVGRNATHGCSKSVCVGTVLCAFLCFKCVSQAPTIRWNSFLTMWKKMRALWPLIIKAHAHMTNCDRLRTLPDLSNVDALITFFSPMEKFTKTVSALMPIMLFCSSHALISVQCSMRCHSGPKLCV